MPKSLSYDELTRRIQALEAEREKARQREVAGVIGKIKVAIEHYGITAAQLGFGAGASGAAAVAEAARPKRALRRARSAKPGKPARASAAAGSGSGPMYKTAIRFADGQGNGWSGFGPKPKWFKEALAAGRSEADLRVASGSNGAG